MTGTPIRITLYNEESEVVGEHTRMFVPWKLLKAAVKISKTLDAENLREEDVDALAGLVCEVFGNKFSIEDLNNGADISEMMAVLNAIVSKAKGPAGTAGPT